MIDARLNSKKQGTVFKQFSGHGSESVPSSFSPFPILMPGSAETAPGESRHGFQARFSGTVFPLYRPAS
jgi:hypothetical protein